MSSSITSLSINEGSRPLSASAVMEASVDTMLSVNDGRKRRRKSLSMINFIDGRMTHGDSLSTSAGLSSSLDAQSGLEEPLPMLTTKSFSIALANELCMTSSSLQLASDHPKNKSATKDQRSSITPKIKLKPRAQRRNDNIRPFSLHTAPPKIFIPFLPSHPVDSPPKFPEKRQNQPREEPLPNPPPPMPFFPVQSLSFPSTSFLSTPTTPDASKIGPATIDPIPLYRKKDMKRTSATTTPLMSPPQLTPSIEYGISSVAIDAITPPPPSIRPLASLATPPSAMVIQTPLPLMSSVDTYKNCGGRSITSAVMAKPIARRPVITPSSRYINRSSSAHPAPIATPPSSMIIQTPLALINSVETYKNSKGDVISSAVKALPRRPIITPSNRFVERSKSTSSPAFFPMLDDCSPQRLFPGSARNHNSVGAGANLSSSMACSAFSFSSAILSPSIPPTIRKTLSANDCD